MFIRIDGAKIADAKTLHAELASIFGFPKSYGKNLDALVDCLTELDNPKTKMTKITVPTGQVATLVIENADAFRAKAKDEFHSLVEAIAFVNHRRMLKGQPSVLSVAYDIG
jgi:RNAse (barnase) inhibitor barstar